MGGHRIPAIANRLGRNRGFDSAWYSDANYAVMLQKDWLLSRAVWSFVQRSSRSMPRQQLSQSQQTQELLQKRCKEAGLTPPGDAPSGPQQKMLDYPNFRVGRIFLQHMPYKSYANTFAYTMPKEGPQAKYGLFPRNSKDNRPKSR